MLLIMSMFIIDGFQNELKQEGKSEAFYALSSDTNFHSEQLNFMSQLPVANYNLAPNNELFEAKPKVTSRGPFNVGGRTEAVAIDVRDDNHIIAGGQTGDLWRTRDGGQSWERINTPENNIYGIGNIVQDPREGFQHIWYYSISTKGYKLSKHKVKNLIYRSSNSGLSWEPFLKYSDLGDDQKMRSVHKIVVAPIDGKLIVAGGSNVVEVGLRGGDVFISSIPPLADSWNCSNVGLDVFTTGEIVAAVPIKERSDRFLLRRTNGVWEDITLRINDLRLPESERIEVAVSQSLNENRSRSIYFFSTGQETEDYPHEYRLFYCTINLENERTRVTWEDRTENLGLDLDYLGQTDYNQCIAVHPGDPEMVFIGSVGLVRSTDGFRTPNNVIKFRGGNVGLHNDQQKILFYPSNSNKMLVANDGGLYATSNGMVQVPVNFIREINVPWEDLNTDYVTTQAYSVAIPPRGNRTAIAAGFQDQGSRLSFEKEYDDEYVMPTRNDGMYCQFSNDGRFLYTTNQYGNIPRISLDYGNRTFRRQRDEIWSETNWSGRPFFVLDPNQDGLAYVIHESEFIKRYRNFNENFRSDLRINFPLEEEDQLSTLTVSNQPANILYVATKLGHLYRVDNADSPNPRITEITRDSFLQMENMDEEQMEEREDFINNDNKINCIATDPLDGRRVFVVFYGFNTPSIFYSKDAGNNWMNVDGNLSGRNAPTVVSVAVRRLDNRPDYYKVFLGTSMGLLSTKSIPLIVGAKVKTSNIKWEREALESIGISRVSMVQCRASDGMVAVATYGKGLFTFSDEPFIKDLGTVSMTLEEEEKVIDLTGFDFEIEENEDLEYIITETSDEGVISHSIEEETLRIEAESSGITFLTIESSNGRIRSKGKLRVEVESAAERIVFNQSLAEDGNFASFTKSPVVNENTTRIEMWDDFDIAEGSTWRVDGFHVEGKLRQPFEQYHDPLAVKLILKRGEGESREIILSREYSLNDDRLQILSDEVTNRYSFKFNFRDPVRLPEGKYWLCVMPVFMPLENVYPWLWRGASENGNAIERRVDSSLNIDRTQHTNRKLWFRVHGEIENDWRYGAPREVIAEGIGSKKIQLTWELIIANEINRPKQILIERSKNGLDYTQLDIIDYGITSYTDEHRISDGLYKYRLKILQAGRRESLYSESNEILIGRGIKTPVGLRILAITDQGAILNWEPDYVDNPRYSRADELVLYRRFTFGGGSANYFHDSGFEEVAVLDGNAFTYYDNLPYNGVYYQYKLEARNRWGEALSNACLRQLSEFSRTVQNFTAIADEDNVNISWQIDPYGIENIKLVRHVRGIGINIIAEADLWQEGNNSIQFVGNNFLVLDGDIMDEISFQELLNNPVGTEISYYLQIKPFHGSTMQTERVEATLEFRLPPSLDIIFREDTSLEKNTFNIYPNPFNGSKVIVDLSEFTNSFDLKLEIRNLSGSLIYSNAIKNDNKVAEINLNKDIAPGMYLVSVTDGNSKFTKKMVKK